MLFFIRIIMISSFPSSFITSATPIPLTAASTAEEIMDDSYYSDYETYNPEEDDKLLDCMPGTVATFSCPWYILHYENLLDEDNYSDVIEFIEGVTKEMCHEFDLGDINISPNSVI